MDCMGYVCAWWWARMSTVSCPPFPAAQARAAAKLLLFLTWPKSSTSLHYFPAGRLAAAVPAADLAGVRQPCGRQTFVEEMASNGLWGPAGPRQAPLRDAARPEGPTNPRRIQCFHQECNGARKRHGMKGGMDRGDLAKGGQLLCPRPLVGLVTPGPPRLHSSTPEPRVSPSPSQLAAMGCPPFRR